MPFDPDKFVSDRAQSAPAPSSNFDASQFQSNRQDLIAQQSAAQDSVTPGKTAKLSLPQSPLSPMERGAFGWIGDPIKQKSYLEGKFGKDNVQWTKVDDGKENFVVKAQDGNWRQVDPAGLSDIPSDLMRLDVRKALSRVTNFDWKNTVGGAAQFLGEHGIDSAGAAYGGATGAAAGSALGPVGTLGGAIAGGALGGAAGGAATSGVRKALDYVQKSTGVEIPGAQDVTGPELSHQVMSSMLFGAAQELATPFLKAGINGSSKVFASVLSRLGGSNPASKQAQAMLIQGLSGMKEGEARAWVESPHEVANYIPQAIKDRINNTDTLRGMQKSTMDEFFDSAQKGMRNLGKQYEAINKQASGKVFDAFKEDEAGTNPIMEAFNAFKEQRYINEKGEVLKSNPGEITRDVSGNNGAAISKITDDFRGLIAKGGKASFQDLRIMERNIEQRLFGDNAVSDGTLRNLMNGMRTAINNVQSKGLHEVDPGLSQRLMDLNKTYGPAKDLLGVLGQKTADQRADAFLKQVIRDDGSYNSELMTSVGKMLGIDNPSKKILQMEVAKKAAVPFVGSSNLSLFGAKVPSVPGLARAAMGGVSAYQDLTGGIAKGGQSAHQAIAPYLSKLHDTYRALPDGLRNDFVTNPDVVKGVQDMVSGAVVNENPTAQKMLKQTGAFQQSQFGN